MAVADVEGRPRRSYSFANPDGSQTDVEIGADPSTLQLSDLANNLPIAARDRSEALSVFLEGRPMDTGTTVAVTTAIITAVATVAAAANQLGLF